MAEDSNVIRPDVPEWYHRPDSVPYPWPTPEDLKESAEKIGQLTVSDVMTEDELKAILNTD